MSKVQRLSTPGPGRTLLGEAEARAEPLRLAGLKLIEGANDSYARGFRERFVDPLGPEARGAGGELEMRAAWASIAMWLLGRLVGPLDESADLGDGEEWFAGSTALSRSVSTPARREAMSLLQRLTVDAHLGDLLPYVLDPVGLGTRRAVIRDSSQAAARASKKAAGVYYTPTDVADYMLDSISALEEPGGLVDPACGSGVFLRAALRRARRLGMPISDAARQLYGMDVSPWAVEMCAFVLTAEYLSAVPSAPPHTTWLDFRRRLACANSLYFRPSQSGWADSVGKGFRYVVANPPYAQLGKVSDPGTLVERFPSLQRGWSPSTNAFVPFVELMWQLGCVKADSVMVVPLSIAYSSTKLARTLRRSMQVAGGRWEFAFFDRMPDALFGDDVKQRCAIVIRHGDAEEFSVATGPLQRWTSRTRSRLFASISFTPLETREIEHGVPKLGTALEAKVFRKVRGLPRPRFADAAVRSHRCSIEQATSDPRALLVSGTAYNWISVLAEVAHGRQVLTSPSVSPLLGLEFATVPAKWVAYALLNSRLVYWLWRVEGDAFHVPKGFVDGLPLGHSLFELGEQDHLAELGIALWAGISDRPIVSTNGGRETVTYCPYAEPAVLDQIDAAVIDALNLPSSFGEYLSEFVLRTTVVDFEDPKRMQEKGRALTGWVAV